MKNFLTVLLFACFFGAPAFAQVAIIVNPALNEDVTMVDIARLYTGRSSVLQPVNLPESDPKRATFDDQAVGRSSAQLKAYWSRLVFTGKGTPPPELNNDAEVIAFVAENIYGIGYIDAAKVTDQVRVLFTLE